jgi:hypothetical protein
LVWRKIYRKPLYWGKPWFTVDFPFNQSNENLIHKWYPEAITSFWTWQALGLHPPIFRRTRMLVAWCPPLIWDDHSQWTNLVQEGWFFSVKVNFKKRLNIHNIFIYIYTVVVARMSCRIIGNEGIFFGDFVSLRSFHLRPKDLAPALVILSKNAGDADDAEAFRVRFWGWGSGTFSGGVWKSRGMCFLIAAS